MADSAGVGVREGSGLEALLLIGDLTFSFRDALVAGVVVGEGELPNARPNPVNPPYLGFPSLLLLSSYLVATGFGSDCLVFSPFASFDVTLPCSTLLAFFSSKIVTTGLVSLAVCEASLSEL